jgi:diguanylate cyclase
MAADVDAHQTRVQAVNNSLSSEVNTSRPGMVYDAVNKLIEANEAMQTQLQAAQDQIHDQAVQIETAERRAQTDALTRVPNRRAFDEHLTRRHSMGAASAGTLALLDVDHFKQFNDVYGHRAGDEVLRIVANVLHARLNAYGLVARFGGEEFAVILDGCSIDQARDLIEAARIAIGERDIQFEDKRLRVAACAGIAELNAGESPGGWLQRADDGLYRSKASGRNCAHWMDGDRPVRIELGKETVDIGIIAPSDEFAGERTAPGVQPSPTAADDAANSASHPQSITVTGGFDYLPDRQVLGETFSEIRGRLQSICMVVMSVRCHGLPDKHCMQSLLQIVRATMRPVDRIGCEDDGTLLVCMPSIDELTAIARGRQICRSVEAVKLASKDGQRCEVTIGLAAAEGGERFERVAAHATELADRAHEEGIEPILTHHAVVV